MKPRSPAQKAAEARYEATGRKPRELATVNITGLSAAIDAARGNVSRAAWCRQAVEEKLSAIHDTGSIRQIREDGGWKQP